MSAATIDRLLAEARGLCDRRRVRRTPTKDVFLLAGSVDNGFESRPVSSVAAMPIQDQFNVRALNDGFTALNSVAAMPQSGRDMPLMSKPPTPGIDAFMRVLRPVGAVSLRDVATLSRSGW